MNKNQIFVFPIFIFVDEGVPYDRCYSAFKVLARDGLYMIENAKDLVLK